MINGASHPLAASISVAITRDPVTFSVYATNSSGNHQQSGTASASLTGYTLPTPQIYGTVVYTGNTMAIFITRYKINLRNGSNYDGTETFTINCHSKSLYGSTGIEYKTTCTKDQFPIDSGEISGYLQSPATAFCTVEVSRSGYESASSEEVRLTDISD